MNDTIRFAGDATFNLVTTDGNKVTLTGYAMKWNELSSDRGGYTVRLLPGSAKPTENCFACWAHDMADVLGCTGNGTLTLENDQVGVKFSLQLPDTQRGRDAAALIGRRDVQGVSFRMETVKGDFVETPSGNVLEVTEFTYSHVAPVAEPAFIGTNVALTLTPPPPTADNNRSNAAARLRLEKLKLAHQAARHQGIQR